MNLGPDRPPRRREEARQLFRNAILDAAEAVFADRGFHGARIQDIAERARIAVGTVYNHFTQKDDVLHALLEERTAGLLATIREGEDDPTGFRARLEARVARMLAYVREHRAFFAIANEHGLFAGAVAPSARSSRGGTDAAHATSERSRAALERMETFRACFRAIVEEGIASGDLEPLDADALARFLGGTMRAFILSSLAQDGADVQEQAAMTTDLFLHGAARRRKRAR
ncbi:MAG TPA: TetR/AcrR family transcriptional regulator [Polyangiaceae bacterium]|jgi:AcrR family transcriptional regulator|nr:TetR/AcrR family transcriptional regulator [Polyangiaceae bacterium]